MLATRLFHTRRLQPEWLENRPPSSPQSLHVGCMCIPGCRGRKNPSHFSKISVSAWLEGVLQTSWDHSVELIFCSGKKHHARHNYFMQPALRQIVRIRR